MENSHFLVEIIKIHNMRIAYPDSNIVSEIRAWRSLIVIKNKIKTFND